MKTFKICLTMTLFVLLSGYVFAQDEIYNEKPKVVIVVDSVETYKANKMDTTGVDPLTTNVIKGEDEYYTEQDYYEEKYGGKHEEKVIYTEEEVKEEYSQKRNNEGLRIITEVVVEVLFNVLLIFSWGH